MLRKTCEKNDLLGACLLRKRESQLAFSFFISGKERDRPHLLLYPVQDIIQILAENRINDEAYEAVRNELHDKLLAHMDDTRDLYRGYQWKMRPWRKNVTPDWNNGGYTRQRENEEYEPRQLDYDTGLPMEKAVRNKLLY